MSSNYSQEQKDRIETFVEELKQLQLEHGVNLSFDREMGEWYTMLDDEFDSPAEFRDSVEADAEHILESLS